MARRHAALVLALVACGQGRGGQGSTDLAVNVDDLAVPGDLAMAPGGDLAFAGPGDGGTGTTVTPGALDRFLVRGRLLLPSGPLDGELLVQGNTITCVAPSCSGMAGAAGATIITAGGFVIPGLIDAHNHGLFDIFDASDWTPTKLYGNHNQWTAETRYSQLVAAKKWIDGENPSSTVDVGCEMDKYAEVKALLAATTSIVVDPGTMRACYASLTRTIDTAENDLGSDTIQTSISVPTDTQAMTICSNFGSGKTNAYVVHVAEGVDTTARNEFSTLASRASGCLMTSKTTIVHGTALQMTDFQQMATAKMHLVWSPQSNVFLYGATARIDLALAAGVPVIALAPDWSIGGGINMLDELRYARGLDQSQFSGVIGAPRLYRMVTLDAARALGVDASLGSLEVGKRADLALVDGNPNDPYVALATLRPAAVELVMVDGRVLYGDAALSAAAATGAPCDTLPVCGAQKFLCAAEASTANKLNQTFAQITQALTDALGSYDAMVAASGVAPFSPLAPLTNCN